MSPQTPPRAPAVLEDALARVLDCPLNDPAWTQEARAFLLALPTPPRLDDFSLQRPLPPLSAVFDAAFYLERNPDVGQAGIEPYLHFLAHGIGEGRDPHPLVDLAYVRSRIGGDAQVQLDPGLLARALADPNVGTHALFDAAAYLESNPDVREAGLPPLQHYIRHGAEEGRRPHPAFDPDAYLAEHPGSANGRYEAFLHYVGSQRHRGEREGNAPPRMGDVETPVAVQGEEAGFEGFFDAVHAGSAHGWAWLPGEPGRSLSIEIVADGQVVGRGAADVFRQDLEAHGVGDGHHAFQLRLSRELDDGRSHLLRARVAGSAQWLQGEVGYTAASQLSGEHDALSRRDARDAARSIAAAMPEEDARAFEDEADRVQLLLETGDLETAFAAADAARLRYPDNPLFALQASEALIGLGRPDQAIACCRRAAELAGEGGFAALCWLHLGNASRVLGQWHEAEAAYVRALAHDAGLDAARRRLGEVEDRAQLLGVRRFLAEGDAEAALARLVPQLIRRPDDEALHNLVHKAVEGREGEPALLGGQDRRSLQAVRLLRVVVDHLRASGAAP